MEKTIISRNELKANLVVNWLTWIVISICAFCNRSMFSTLGISILWVEAIILFVALMGTSVCFTIVKNNEHHRVSKERKIKELIRQVVNEGVSGESKY